MLRTIEGFKRFNFTSSYFKNIILKPFILQTPSRNHYQQNLPQQPVPDLEKVLQIYLKSVVPFLSEDELKRAREKVAKFSDENGNLLQRYALERAKDVDNWQADYFCHNIFLNHREPLPYLNPAHICEFLDFKNETERINYTARFIQALLNFKQHVDEDTIPVSMSHDKLEYLGQYKLIFGTCRIPGFQRDYLNVCTRTDYIIVACNNHFYKVPVYNGNHDVISIRQLEVILHDILKLSVEDVAPVGILTSDYRDNCYAAYERLQNYPENIGALADIRDALFLICLDNIVMEDSGGKWENAAANQLLHGGGSRFNTGNRWFGKSTQCIIGKDGTTGIILEHSLYDGMALFTMTDYIMDYMNEGKHNNLLDTENLRPFEEIQFKLDNKLMEFIERAKQNADRLANNLDGDIFKFDLFGKDFIKSHKLNSDCFIQMAIQYASYSLYGEPCAQLEAVNMLRFIKGRTNTVRSCSIESTTFARYMLSTTVSDEDKLKALRNAVNSHKELIIQTKNGYSVDDHLFALEMIGNEKKIKLPSLYEDKSYLSSGYTKLLTSQIMYKHKISGFYSPLVEDGYSCCYHLRDDEISFGIFAFNSCPHTSAARFREALSNSLKSMHDLLRRHE